MPSRRLAGLAPVLLALVVLVWPACGWAQAVAEAPTPVATAPAAAVPPTESPPLDAPADVGAVLAARAPTTVADLRLIQTQLQRVLARVIPATASVEIRRSQGRGIVAGSGVVVSKDGLVLTAAHVIGRAGRRAVIELPDGRRLQATTLGANHDLDAGMLRIEEPPPDLPFVPVSTGPELDPGEWVVTVGQPGGITADRTPPVRFGRVLFRGDSLLCTDCKLVGGDSGGPLFNMRGEVVGIHTSIGPMITHNFHVPIAGYRAGWERLLAGDVWGGRYDEDDDKDRPVLGVAGHAEGGRCVLTEVFSGLPAAQAGVRVGDAVSAVNGRPISTFDELARIIYFKSAGEKLELTIERQGATLNIEVQLGAADGPLPGRRPRPEFEDEDEQDAE